MDAKYHVKSFIHGIRGFLLSKDAIEYKPSLKMSTQPDLTISDHLDPSPTILHSIIHRVPVVSITWANECLWAGCMVDPNPFVLIPETFIDGASTVFARINFIISKSCMETQRRYGLDISKIITSMGGIIFQSVRSIDNPELQTYFIVNPLDKSRLIYNKKRLFIWTVSFKWIYDCLMKQALQNPHQYMQPEL